MFMKLPVAPVALAFVAISVSGSMTGCSAEAGPTGENGEQGPAGEKGEQGEPGDPGMDGEQGADGSLRVYGDGSAGDLVVRAGATLELDGSNPQYETIVVDGELTIPSGITLRSRTIAIGPSGSVVVGYGTSGPRDDGIPHPGLSRRGAVLGQAGTGAVPLTGGSGGEGISEPSARTVLRLGLDGGGGSGGKGGDVNFDNTTAASGPGQPGYVFTTLADPTALL
jgi:hypothetical protein